MTTDRPSTRDLSLHGIPGIPFVVEGDSLATLILDACEAARFALADGDVLVLAQKIVSKAEGRTVALSTVTPSGKAKELAKAVGKDPRLVELILGESQAVVRHKPGVLVVEDNRGLVLANAGIDHSNVEQSDEVTVDGSGDTVTDTVLLLPEDPDRSAELLRNELKAATNKQLAVVICDSLGRAWRVGTVGIAIGSAGLPAVIDLRGEEDLYGIALRTTDVGHADQLAAAASLLMGQAAEAMPVVVIRGASGLGAGAKDSPATALLRPKEQDMFR